MIQSDLMKAHLIIVSVLLAASHSNTHADDAAAREELASKLVGITADDLRATEVPGLYEIARGPNILYVSADGRYLVRGQLIDLTTHENLTESRRADVRATWNDSLDESTMVIFAPEGPVTHTVTVFTDIDCGYCRQFHSGMDDLLGRGIRVRYLFYPRSGVGTESAATADAVWCSADRHRAMTRAKAGQRIPARACGTTPVATHLEWGREFGVTGTPAIVTEGGDLIPGYLPPARLIAELNRLRAVRASQRSR